MQVNKRITQALHLHLRTGNRDHEKKTCRHSMTVKKEVLILILLACLTTMSIIVWTVKDIFNSFHLIEIPVEYRPHKTEILLLSYGRSGSSFTSSIISHYSDVFFVYEPLAALEFKSKSYYNNTFEYVSKDIIKAFFSCNLMEVDHLVLRNIQMRNSQSTSHFYYCFKKLLSGVDHLACFKNLTKSCRNHTIVFQKTIRFSVKWTETFLNENPNFALLFLIRDPRATVYSQSKVFQYFNWKKDTYYFARKHCQRLEYDLVEFERLKLLYPQQVQCIRYEDGALNPLTFAKNIYSFLGFTLSNEVMDFVNISTSSNDKKLTYYSTKRKSKEAMNKWRSVAGYTHVHEVDLACGHLYLKLGYSTVMSKKDLLSNRSLVTTPIPGGIF